MSEKRLSGSRPSASTKSAALPHRRGSLSISTATVATSTATTKSPIQASVESTISPRRTRDHSQPWIPRTFSRNTPVLPHDKRSYSHHYRLPRLLRHRWIQFVILIYATFSVLLTFTHLCQWTFSDKTIPEPPVQIKEWEPKRTYLPDDPYSAIDDMSMALQFSKMFSKSLPGTIEYTKPYWQRAHVTPTAHDISLTTWVTDKNYDQLIRIAQMWNGPLSVTLHIEATAPISPETVDLLDQIRLDLLKESSIVQYADIHLLVTPPSHSGALALSHNSDRNFARLFARTEFICYLPIELVPATELRDTLERNFDSFAARLRAGDVFVVPTFAYSTADQVPPPETDWEEQGAEDDEEVENVEREQHMTLVHDETVIPRTKPRLLQLVESGAMGSEDRHWPIGSGPTDFNKWKAADKLFAVEDYEFHYEPVVIESRNVQPWCSERFADNGAACLYATYLTGANFWVLPHDFVVRVKEQPQTWLSSTETVIQNRLYAKFVWELCVHHARLLDAEGLWNTDRSRHAKASCSRVINSWGKGLVGE